MRHRDGILHRAPSGRPFTSDLTGQAFWSLLRTGHGPVGMVMGSCVYHVAHRGMLNTLGQISRNVELPNYTQALYHARELAMQRMQSEAQDLRAKGIVGVDLQEKSHGWGSHIIEFFAIGTAIVPIAGEHKIGVTIVVGPWAAAKCRLRPWRGCGAVLRLQACDVRLRLAERYGVVADRERLDVGGFFHGH